jgi:hypothetical protein
LLEATYTSPEWLAPFLEVTGCRDGVKYISCLPEAAATPFLRSNKGTMADAVKAVLITFLPSFQPIFLVIEF